MRNKILSVILAGIMVFMCSACSSNTEKNIDTAAMAAELSQKLSFDDELQKVDSEGVKVLYGIDYAEEAQLYMGSGATAEEIAVFKLKTDEDASKAEQAAKDRIESQKKAFENYAPQEMSRLDKAIVVKNGHYVVLCVSSDSNAQNVIDSYF